MQQRQRRSFMGRMAVLAAMPVLAATAYARTRHAPRRDTQSSDDDRLKAMEKQMQEMSVQLGLLQDTEAIRRLHNAYGYYFDRGLYEAVINLFTEDGEVQYAGLIYRGRAGLWRLYGQVLQQRWLGAATPPVNGWLHDQLMVQDVIDVAPDRRTAQVRVRCFIQAGSHDSRAGAPAAAARQWWEGGIHENTCAKGDDGLWRIRQLRYYPVYQAGYEQGWAHAGDAAAVAVASGPAGGKPTGGAPAAAAAPAGANVPPAGPNTPPAGVPPTLFPDDPQGPDALASEQATWPEMPIIAFHYPHPVTGKPV